MSQARSSASQSLPPPSGSRAFSAWLLAVLVTFGFPSVFSGGTCTWHSDDCDDNDFDDDDFDDDDWDDCDWDDDDVSASSSKARPEQEAKDPYRLVKFERVASHEPGSHPVAWLRHIQEINLFHAEGPTTYRQEDFEMFTGLLLQVNKDLLGLPVGSGLLTFDGVEFETDASQEDSIRVRWRQEAQQPNGSWRLVPESEVVFYFDAVGRLVTVKNHTWVQPPQR